MAQGSGSRVALLKRILEGLEKDERTTLESVNVFASHGAKIVPFDLQVKLSRIRQHIQRIRLELEAYGKDEK